MDASSLPGFESLTLHSDLGLVGDVEMYQDELMSELDGLRDKVAKLEAECASLRLQTPESELDAALLEAVDALVVYDKELRYTYINATGAAFLGKSPHEVIGKTNEEIIGSVAESVEPYARKAFDTGEKVFIVHE